MWYLIVSIPDLCRLSFFALASHRYCSTHCVEVVDILEKKKLNCKNYHFQELCFSKVSNVRSISESFGKPHLSLILTNQCLTIMVRKYCPVMMTLPMFGSRGDRGSGHSPWKITSTYMGFYRNKHLDPPPPPWKKLDTPPLPENNGPPLDPL